MVHFYITTFLWEKYVLKSRFKIWAFGTILGNYPTKTFMAHDRTGKRISRCLSKLIVLKSLRTATPRNMEHQRLSVSPQLLSRVSVGLRTRRVELNPAYIPSHCEHLYSEIPLAHLKLI